MHRQETSYASDIQTIAATAEETRSALLTRAKQTHAPILKAFVQKPKPKDNASSNRSAPLSSFVKRSDLRGLQAFLFMHAIISSDDPERGWSTSLPLAVWARAFGTNENAEPVNARTAASKIMGRIEREHLIAKERKNKEVKVTLLRPDGSGEPYTRPARDNSDRYLKLSNAYWTKQYHKELTLPGIAMLLVALHEKPGFELPTEKMPQWYGWSADTAERGFKELRDAGILQVDPCYKKAPLAPEGVTRVNRYTVLAPFANTSSPAVLVPTETHASTEQKD